MMSDWKVEILRYPTEEDWKRCLLFARATQGKFDAPNEPSDEWKRKILRSEHSPIRTLMFTIKLDGIPYCNSVHFVRHKYGVEHYVQSQRKNPERGAERQDAPVTHIMDINAAELIFMARKRLCFKADLVTHGIMAEIVYEICKKDEIYRGVFAPACGCNEQNCREFKPCGMFSIIQKNEENQPLTWEELRTMQDKPVWWMHGEVGEWLTIYRVPTLGNGNDHVIYATTCSGVECWIYKKDMDKYQYYRKEIVND